MILAQKFKLTKGGKEKKWFEFSRIFSKRNCGRIIDFKSTFHEKKPGILDFESARNDLKNPILKRIVDEEEMYILVKLCFLLL